MAAPIIVRADDGPLAIPHAYELGPNETLQLQSVTALWHGGAASGDFWPAVSVYSQDGRLLGRFIPPAKVTQGDDAEVTYGPF